MWPLPTNACVVPQLPGFHRKQRGAKALCGKTLGEWEKQESKGREPSQGVPRMWHCLNSAAHKSFPIPCHLCEAVPQHKTQGEEGSTGRITRFKPNQPTQIQRRKQHNFRAPVQGKGPAAATFTECDTLKGNLNSTLTVPWAVQLLRQIKLKPQKAMCEEIKNVHKNNYNAEVLYSCFVL